MKKTLCTLLLVFLAIGTYASAQNVQAEWQKSKHSDRELVTNDVGVWELRKGATAMCGRCHDEQGFKAWVPRLMKGDPGLLKKPDGQPADEAFLKGLGLTKAEARPITCTTCHSQGAKLRITDDIPMLPNGIAVRGMGKGALCMACHNTRNGRVAWDATDPKQKYMQPHDASQVDVILGKNVYFYNDTVDSTSPHAAFTGDSCVACHKKLSTGGHTFKPAECGVCHGEKVQEAFVQNGISDLQKQLAALIEKKLFASKDRIACVSAWDPKQDNPTYTGTPNVAIDAKQIKAIEIPQAPINGIHGDMSIKIVMQDGKEIYSQFGNVTDACGASGKLVYPTTDPVIRASWNYYLFRYDGSKGVHNPRFARNVLLATIDAMSK